MIASIIEYQKAREELQSLEVQLAQTMKAHPLGSKRFTKVGFRKMIVRLHEELAHFEHSEEARHPATPSQRT